MARRSNKSIGEILTPPPRSQAPTAALHASSLRNNDGDDLLLLDAASLQSCGCPGTIAYTFWDSLRVTTPTNPIKKMLHIIEIKMYLSNDFDTKMWAI